ncbi:MAG: DEAD/DEAH box helicase [Planctomycetes bacterium]|nr:DEAD/DEAH box helicase [Planctomycetota bacterium]
MVDFSRRLGKRIPKRITDPVALYDTLDRASDKGPLRPAQEAVLKHWYVEYADVTDVILKMHTGQGKTLVGLLMLHSKLNAGQGPALYLCANRFLVNQTHEQAEQFGLPVCTTDDDLPNDFIDGKSILITTVHKLFNGLTRFGLGNKAKEVGAIVIDDAHACVDSIREAFIIRLKNSDSAYTGIRDLFADELEKQGVGTFADIRKRKYDAMLPVPYWAWLDRAGEVADILSGRSDARAVKFAWPLIRDMLDKCQCVVSGGALEIVPYLPPLHLFRSYDNATCRVFMSATVADDSFLVKGLGLAPEVVSKPLTYEKEKWSGEKMVLIPSLIDESLDRGAIVGFFAKPKENRPSGVVALVPSFKHAGNWESHDAIIAKAETIDSEIEKLRSGDRDNTVVIVNRYDGIDLPDASCRVLIFDSEPYSESLVDLYVESCRPGSETTAIRKARTIEQGLGRSVRGERDYCIIIITGVDLVKCVRSRRTRGHLSRQTQLQIQIGFDIAEMAKEDLHDGSIPVDALKAVMNQCLRRDAAWKAFYAEQMETVETEAVSQTGLEIFSRELRAEQLHQRGESNTAVEELQSLIDDCVTNEEERGWYLQEMARYTLLFDATESNNLQRRAHLKNHGLLRPSSGMQIERIVVVSQKRMGRVIAWIKKQETYEELRLVVDDILDRLTFGIKAERFEDAFKQLGAFLGFVSQRPEKEWKEGPDNLWGLRESEYLLVECKSEVAQDRAKITEHEVVQMNKSCAWFDAQYKDSQCHRWIVIPPRKLARKASFTHEVVVLRKHGLTKFVNNVKRFTEQLKGVDFEDLSERKIQELIDRHKLSVDAICSEYTKSVFVGRRR